MVTEQEVKEALRCIMDNRTVKALNYAVNYAKEGLLQTGETLRVQCLYVLENMKAWRGEDAKRVRETLKTFTKQKQLEIYKIWQEVNTGWDTYDSAIVLAYSKKDAKKIHPQGEIEVFNKEAYTEDANWPDNWCFLEDVRVKQIGIATTGEAGQVVCASYNAG